MNPIPVAARDSPATRSIDPPVERCRAFDIVADIVRRLPLSISTSVHAACTRSGANVSFVNGNEPEIRALGRDTRDPSPAATLALSNGINFM
jgi:hypothetical protein